MKNEAAEVILVESHCWNQYAMRHESSWIMDISHLILLWAGLLLIKNLVLFIIFSTFHSQSYFTGEKDFFFFIFISFQQYGWLTCISLRGGMKFYVNVITNPWSSILAMNTFDTVRKNLVEVEGRMNFKGYLCRFKGINQNIDTDNLFPDKNCKLDVSSL
jgi:hypothetical protein